jgi:hypothetical protein
MHDEQVEIVEIVLLDEEVDDRANDHVEVSLGVQCAQQAGESGGGVIDGRNRSAEWVAIEGVPGLAYLAFQRVPEPKLVKNRVHLDISVGDLESAIQTAIGRGAVAVGSVVEEQTNRFQVMHDPEGNEFCFVMHLG